MTEPRATTEPVTEAREHTELPAPAVVPQSAAEVVPPVSPCSEPTEGKKAAEEDGKCDDDGEEDEDDEDEEEVMNCPKTLDMEKHLKFLRRCLNCLPMEYAQQDNNHLTLVYFVIGALDILGELSRSVDSQTSSRLIEYIYSLQLLPIHGNTSEKEATVDPTCGFVGSPYQIFGAPDGTQRSGYVMSNSAMTYVALCVLKILGDNFSRVDVHAITSALHALQKPNGSFVAVAVPGAGECDVRFVYCACVISSLLNDWSGVNKEAAISFILATQTYDGGFGQQPGQESHGGSTYCAVASLALMGELQRLPRRSELLQWLLDRQVSGFQGRINKPADTCYSWWIGATLTLLGAFHLVDFRALRSFLLSCQSGIGGFSKLPEVFPDVLHTYYSFCGLSLGGEPGLAPLDTLLGMTVTSAGKKI